MGPVDSGADVRTAVVKRILVAGAMQPLVPIPVSGLGWTKKKAKAAQSERSQK